MNDDRLSAIERRLDSIQLMLAALCNQHGAKPSATHSRDVFFAEGKAKGLTVEETLRQWNEHLTAVEAATPSDRF